MTGKIVSLSRARKTRAREDKRRQADANAAKFGRSKAEREADDLRRSQAEARQDGHQLDRDTKE